MKTEADRLIVDLTLGADRYEFDGSQVRHTLEVGDLAIEAEVEAYPEEDESPQAAWWRAYLHGMAPRATRPLGTTLHTADLFSGAGGLALGARQVARELGMRPVVELVADVDADAVDVYAANHDVRNRSVQSVKSLLDYSVRSASGGARFLYRPEVLDEQLLASTSRIDMVLAGPPCQGHSNLNNHSRREDPRNSLYLTVPAFAVAVGAPICVIENVPSVVHDYKDVVTIAQQLLESEGYVVETGVLSASDMGWPQTRKRHLMIARRDASPMPLDEIARTLRRPEPLSAWWAIGDLAGIESTKAIDQQTELSPENHARIEWLFDNDAYDLGLPERPPSHQNGTSYMSVYGRMKKDEPAQTITTGFMSPGRGRYVHPTERRVITAHEAARLQGFPDDYEFEVDPANPPTRSKLAKWIGDAVPMPLGYAAVLSALAPGLPNG